MAHSVLLGSLVLLVTNVLAEDNKFGPFDVELGGVTKCDDPGNGDLTLDNFEVKMKSKSMIEMSFDATNKVPFDDSTTITLDVAPFDEQKNEFSTHTIKLPMGPACKAFTTFFPNSYQDFFKSLGLEGCPVPPKTWNVKNYSFELKLPVNEAPYNRFRTDVIFTKDNVRIFCLRMSLRLAPEGTVKY